jgi:ribulose bisphosphate carboxylase small subunit
MSIQSTKGSVVTVGLEHTTKIIESLLASGYKVNVSYKDLAEEVDNMFKIRRYLVEYETDENAAQSLLNVDISEW